MFINVNEVNAKKGSLYENPLIKYFENFRKADSLKSIEELIAAKEVYESLENLCEEDRKTIENGFIAPLINQIKNSYESLKKYIELARSEAKNEYIKTIKSEFNLWDKLEGDNYLSALENNLLKYKHANNMEGIGKLFEQKTKEILKNYVSEVSGLIQSYGKIMQFPWNNSNFNKPSAAVKDTHKESVSNNNLTSSNDKVIISNETVSLTNCPECHNKVSIIECSEGERHGELIQLFRYSCGHTHLND